MRTHSSKFLKKFIFFLVAIASVAEAKTIPPNFAIKTQKQEQQALPFYGGKQQGPFEILSSLDENQAIPADQEITIQVGIKFKFACEPFQLRLRGVDGVQILSQTNFNYNECAKGQIYNNPIKVQIPRSTRGVLAIDVEYSNRSGIHSETRAISLFDQQGIQEFAQKVQPGGPQTKEKVRRSKVEEKILQK